MSELNENCGVVAAAKLKNTDIFSGVTPKQREEKPAVAHWLYAMLLNLQHRGQLSAGITAFDPDRAQLLRTHKGNGTVSRTFATDINGRNPLDTLGGIAGIGHTRYATSGQEDVSHAQPFERWHGRRWKWFSLCFNGTIANFSQLKDKLVSEQDYHLVHDTDTEVLLHYIAYANRGTRRHSFNAVFSELAEILDGSYSLAMINATGDIAIARDPLGFRPLCYGVSGDMFAAASESVALTNLGFEKTEVLEPGMMLEVRNGRIQTHRFADSKRTGYCFFEWIYFASAGSVLDNKSVYLARSALGRELAMVEKERMAKRGLTEEDKKDFIVVPVPDAAKPAADAMAYELKLPCLEGLLRNRYVGRTFIESAARLELARRKYTPLPEVLSGKKILLVEDSIVRLTTLRAIIHQMREHGCAKEIHLRITCPPIIAPCFYGIDMPTVKELFAYRFTQEPYYEGLPQEISAQMAKDIGAESLVYLPINAIPKCIGLHEDQLCMACITGKYLTKWGAMLHEEARQAYEKELAAKGDNAGNAGEPGHEVPSCSARSRAPESES